MVDRSSRVPTRARARAGVRLALLVFSQSERGGVKHLDRRSIYLSFPLSLSLESRRIEQEKESAIWEYVIYLFNRRRDGIIPDGLLF